MDILNNTQLGLLRLMNSMTDDYINFIYTVTYELAPNCKANENINASNIQRLKYIITNSRYYNIITDVANRVSIFKIFDVCYILRNNVHNEYYILFKNKKCNLHPINDRISFEQLMSNPDMYLRTHHNDLTRYFKEIYNDNKTSAKNIYNKELERKLNKIFYSCKIVMKVQ